ncbi:MAG: ABC transporter substrate-binding protein [Rickettsia sp.]|nr:ABC transporter substrate-binding protein [Rickettsia sp.]
MKNLKIITCFAIFFFSQYAFSKEKNVNNELEYFINHTLKEGYQLLQNNYSEEKLRIEVEKLVVKIFDLNWLVTFILGKEAEKYPTQIIEEFKSTYLKYLVSIYHGYALSYKGEQLKIKNIHKVNEEIFLIKTDLVKSTENLINIEYLVKKSNSQCKYKILDIKTQGISLVNTHKSEFSNFLLKNNLPELIKEIQKYYVAN